METLLQHLDRFYATLDGHGVDPGLVRQAVRQLFYVIGAVSFNHLLMWKDMCSWSTGLQIRSRILSPPRKLGPPPKSDRNALVFPSPGTTAGSCRTG